MNVVKASICTIGDEILIGQIVDTNSSMISKALGAAGVRTSRMISIGDKRSTIIETLRNELIYNDIVISTGGLGPTKDDITKDALAELSGSKSYVRNEEQEAIVHRILSARGLDVLDINLRQAMVPEHCEVILNHRGTAPIMVISLSGALNRIASMHSSMTRSGSSHHSIDHTLFTFHPRPLSIAGCSISRLAAEESVAAEEPSIRIPRQYLSESSDSITPTSTLNPDLPMSVAV